MGENNHISSRKKKPRELRGDRFTTIQSILYIARNSHGGCITYYTIYRLVNTGVAYAKVYVNNLVSLGLLRPANQKEIKAFSHHVYATRNVRLNKPRSAKPVLFVITEKGKKILKLQEQLTDLFPYLKIPMNSKVELGLDPGNRKNPIFF